MRMRSVGRVVALAVMTCDGLAADDKWDASGSGDSGHLTSNQLIHGDLQTHDIQGPSVPGSFSDVDFSYVAAKARHSYQVKVSSTNIQFMLNDPCCAGLDRMAANGVTILTAGIAPDGEAPGGRPGWMAVRWTSSADQNDLIKVHGYRDFGAAATDQYDIQMLDTTYLVPRWNNSGTQITVFLIQNGSTAPITGSIFFYNAGGALIHSEPLSLPANGLQVLSTAGISALAGASGSAAIAHDGGYGALAGKAVALEPSTGFAFDTPITPIPH
jgi:hypothetical protein